MNTPDSIGQESERLLLRRNFLTWMRQGTMNQSLHWFQKRGLMLLMAFVVIVMLSLK